MGQVTLAMRPVDRLIVALDHATLAGALGQVESLGDAVERYKVGLELFAAEGPHTVAELRARGKRVFLDLKLHDIPETVLRAARAAAATGADLLTVHASGGREMLARAVEGAGPAAKVLAVTVLTSLDLADLRADGLQVESTAEQVVRRARLAHQVGCAGVVASPLEAEAIRRELGPGFLIVTPGVRLAAASDDQKRVATPRAARQAGADLVVVGRPIRDAADRRAAAAAFLDELT
jgi:orotidine-5'-phosphate decarboxylase